MKKRLIQIWKKFSIKRTSVMFLVLGLLREIFYLFKISLNKSKRITFKKTQIISERYEILQPEELIKYVKYYASTNTSWYPNWKSEINKYSKTPDLLLLDTIDKIQSNYGKVLYLEWLINELYDYPVTGTFDIHEVGYYRDFKRLALDRYKLCLDQPNTLDQESTHALGENSKSSDNRGVHNKKREIIPEQDFWDEAKKYYQIHHEDCLSSRDKKYPNGKMKKWLAGEISNLKLVGYEKRDEDKKNPIRLKRGKIRELLGDNNEKWKVED